MAQPRTLSPAQAREFYDRFGAKQDHQGWYERPALAALVANGAFGSAHAVFELGCGTGAFALELLARHLPLDARYRGVDLSATMVRLARERLAPFVGRAQADPAPERPPFDAPAGGFDRFVSTYVFDLLSTEQAQALLAEAARLLAPGGLLCTAGLTPGRTAPSRIVSALWSGVHRVRPELVGGCRPIVLAERLAPETWTVLHRDVIAAWGIASEVLIAQRR